MSQMTIDVGQYIPSYLYRCNWCGEEIVVFWDPTLMDGIPDHATTPCERTKCKGKMQRVNEITVGRAARACDDPQD